LYSSLFVKDILPYVDFRFEKIKEKIRIIPNAIDHRRFRFSEKEGLEFREKYGLGDSPIVLYVGRISSAKGTDILIRSIKSVKKSIQDVKCIIVGYVPETQEHRNFFNKCKSIVKEQGMENDVVFTGPIPNDQLNPVYSACRLGGVYIQPPRIGEAQSRVCLEAGSMGIPLISTPLGALPDIVREGYSGHLVPHDPSSIAEAIVDILKDHERARAFGENARRLVLEKFNWDATIPMQIEAFEEALQ
jgi:glycosyltransferase involved in cell wall biosynthesis